MIVQLTWHGEPIGTLDVQFVWPPPLDREALLPLLSVSSGSAAISLVFRFSGPLNALELDLARPIVLRCPLGGPTEVGAFQGHVGARFDELAVHGFVAAPIGSRGGKGPRILMQREPGETRFSLCSRHLIGQIEIVEHGGLVTFGAAVEGPRGELRAYPQGGGVIELHSEQRNAPLASLNWRWPRSFDEESAWAGALRALLEFMTQQQSVALLLGFELAQQQALPAAADVPAAAVAPPPRERAAQHAPAAAAAPSGVSSRAVLLGGVAVAVAAFIAAAVFWNPSGVRNDSAVLLPAATVSTGALQPAPARSGAGGDAGGKR
jgi:hypothetical protein